MIRVALIAVCLLMLVSLIRGAVDPGARSQAKSEAVHWVSK